MHSERMDSHRCFEIILVSDPWRSVPFVLICVQNFFKLELRRNQAAARFHADNNNE